MAVKPMSGEEIAKELGITRQAVKNTLHRAMGKVYAALKAANPDMSPFEVCVVMMNGLDVGDPDLSNFFKMLPADVKKEVMADAKKKNPGLVKEGYFEDDRWDHSTSSPRVDAKRSGSSVLDRIEAFLA